MPIIFNLEEVWTLGPNTPCPPEATEKPAHYILLTRNTLFSNFLSTHYSFPFLFSVFPVPFLLFFVFISATSLAYICYWFLWHPHFLLSLFLSFIFSPYYTLSSFPLACLCRSSENWWFASALSRLLLQFIHYLHVTYLPYWLVYQKNLHFFHLSLFKIPPFLFAFPCPDAGRGMAKC